MKVSRKALRCAVGMVVAASTSLGGCASVGPQPWEHDLLAKKEMQLNTNPNLTAFDEHIYFSKEGSSGGRTFDGGGCGCN
jgi:hypothetical protein